MNYTECVFLDFVARGEIMAISFKGGLSIEIKRLNNNNPAIVCLLVASPTCLGLIAGKKAMKLLGASCVLVGNKRLLRPDTIVVGAELSVMVRETLWRWRHLILPPVERVEFVR